MQNFTESFFAEEIAQGSLTMVEHSVGEPFVDADDIAEVAVSALLEPAHAGRVYELAGPALLTFGQVRAVLAREPRAFQDSFTAQLAPDAPG